MRLSDAQELITMIRGATNAYLDDEKVEFWTTGLTALDAEVATKAVVYGVNVWKEFPSWAEFEEVYRLKRREQRDSKRQEQVTVEGKRGIAPPEWVWVWSWARFWRQPRDERSFPQQGDHGDPFNMMDVLEYEGLRQEWLAAGSPQKNPLPGVSAGFSLGAQA